MLKLVCNRCVMDRTDPDITFDESGVCNHCRAADKELFLAKRSRSLLPKLIEDIQKDGGKYDCLIGLSGGADSSMVLHHAVSLGLKPLTFSVDNGWNSKEADENIMRLVEGMKVPFYRYTIDIKAFRDVQMVFLRAGVPNLEIPTDHILMATTYEMASMYGIKHVLSGGNVATESIMPAAWGYNARDLVHIKDVYGQMTGKKLPKTFPQCSLLKWNWYKHVKGIKMHYLLDHMDYNRADAIALLGKLYGYKDYGEKHGESDFTRWFQGYYLFEKYGYDKRKAHFSSLINSGQMTRKEALEELKKPPTYPRLGFEARALRYPRRPHDAFKKDWYPYIAKLVNLCKW